MRIVALAGHAREPMRSGRHYESSERKPRNHVYSGLSYFHLKEAPKKKKKPSIFSRFDLLSLK